MAKIRWEERVSNDEVFKRCGTQNLSVILRRQRLKLFGHVRRREEVSILRRAAELKVGGKRCVGRPRKSWRKCVEEDMWKLGLNEDMVHNWEKWKRVIVLSNPNKGKRRTLNDDDDSLRFFKNYDFL